MIARSTSYARSRDAMGAGLASAGIAARDPRKVVPALEPYREVLDETVIRALPSPNDAEGVLEIARASAP